MLIKHFGLVLALVVLAGCGGRPRVPTITPRSTQITGVVSGGLAMRIDLLIFNPNAYDLTVRSVAANVTAQGHDLGMVEHAQQINLPAGQNVPLVTDVTVPWGDLPSLAATALMQSAIPYNVRGRVIAVYGNFEIEAPFELDGQIPRAMLLRLPGLGVLPLKGDPRSAVADHPAVGPGRLRKPV